MRDLLNYIYVQPPILILIWIVALVTLWSIIEHVQKCRVWQALNLIMLITSIFVILYSTIYNRSDAGTTNAMLIPFYSFIEAKAQPEKYREMLMNVFLFVPFGLTVSNSLSRIRRLWPIVFTVVSAMMLSGAIEFTQYYLRLGRCEVDNVIMNTLGATIGTVPVILVQTGVVEKVAGKVKTIVANSKK